MTRKTYLKSNSIIIKNTNDANYVFSFLKKGIAFSFKIDMRILLFVIAWRSLYFLKLPLVNSVVLFINLVIDLLIYAPLYLLLLPINYPIFMFFPSDIGYWLYFILIEQFLILFLIFTFLYLKDNPYELKITPDSIILKNFPFYKKKHYFKKGDTLFISKEVYVSRFSSKSKIESNWTLSKISRWNFMPFTFKLKTFSDKEIFNLMTNIKNLNILPVKIDMKPVKKSSKYQSIIENYPNAIIKISDLPSTDVKYSLKIKKDPNRIVSSIYNLIISFAIFLCFIKFFFNPSFKPLSSRILLYFYENNLIFSSIFLVLLIVRFYYFSDVFFGKIILLFNRNENELRILNKKIFFTKNIFSISLDNFKSLNIIRSNLVNKFYIEIEGEENFLIDYPLMLVDASDFSHLINKNISLLKI